MKAQQQKVHIRWMIRRDMPRILEIESESFEHPWSEEDFLRCLRQRMVIGMVAEIHDRVVGYEIHEAHKTTIDLLNIAVDPEYRRQRIGTQLLQKLISKLSPRGRKIGLMITESNLDGQLFFRELGFRAKSVAPDFFERTGEDAYFMEYRHTGNSYLPVNRISKLGS